MENNKDNTTEEHMTPEEQVNPGATAEMHVDPMPEEHVHHSFMGILIGVMVVLLVVILGGLYLWGGVLTKEAQAPAETTPPPAREIPNNEPETPRASADVQVLETVSPSDEVEAIEADLDGTLLELDEELNSIDALLEGDLQVQ